MIYTDNISIILGKSFLAVLEPIPDEYMDELSAVPIPYDTVIIGKSTSVSNIHVCYVYVCKYINFI